MSGGEEDSIAADHSASTSMLASGSNLESVDRGNVEALRSPLGSQYIMDSPSLSPFNWDTFTGRHTFKHPASGQLSQDAKRGNRSGSRTPVVASHDIKLVTELDKALERVNIRHKSPFDTHRISGGPDNEIDNKDTIQLFGGLKALRIKAIRHHLMAWTCRGTWNITRHQGPFRFTQIWDEAHNSFRRTLTTALMQSNKPTVRLLADRIETATAALRRSQSDQDYERLQDKIERAEAVEVRRLVERKTFLRPGRKY